MNQRIELGPRIGARARTGGALLALAALLLCAQPREARAVDGVNNPDPTTVSLDCAKLGAVDALGLHCADADAGVVIASSPERAERLSVLAGQAAVRFAHRFGRPAPPFLVLDSASEAQADDMRARVRLEDVPVVQQWLSPDALSARLRDSVERGVRAQMLRHGLPEAQIDAAVASALVQAAQAIDPAAAEQREQTALAHELGHKWLVHAFWGEQGRAQQGGHYGGPGPDWLDEMAAILVEPESSLDERRQQFLEAVARLPAETRGADPLTDIVAMIERSHPLSSALAAHSANGSGGKGRLLVMTGPEAAAFAGSTGAPQYYLRVLALFDYLQDRTADVAIAGRLAEALAGGASFPEWLASQAGKGQLPTSIEALAGDWQSWIKARSEAHRLASPSRQSPVPAS